MSASPKDRSTTSLLLKFPVHVTGIRLMGSSPMALNDLYVPKVGQIDRSTFREQTLQPFKNFLFLSQVPRWSNITLEFFIPGNILSSLSRSSTPLENSSLCLLSLAQCQKHQFESKPIMVKGKRWWELHQHGARVCSACYPRQG